MKPKLLVTRHIYPEAIDLLSGHAEIEYHDDSAGLSAQALRGALTDKQAVICQLTDTIDAAVIDAAINLKVIANVAVGFDNIDVPAASGKGIVVTNTPGVLTDTTADCAFALLMAAARRVTEAERFLREGHWHQWEIDLLVGRDVHHQTLGILGMGRIGRAVARRAGGFGMQILYHDALRVPADTESELGLRFVDKETLLREADFVSVHVPLNEATRHYLGAPELALMKPGAILVNTSRGPVVDEKALAVALAEKRIAGAGLDVFEHEPEVEPGLLALDNVVIVPHIGSASIKTRTRMCTMAAENVLAVLSGSRPPNPVNPEVLGD